MAEIETIKCVHCAGKGLDPTDLHKYCPECGGNGKVVKPLEPKSTSKR